MAQWLKNPPLTTGSPISHLDHAGSIPGLGRAPAGGNGHQLQFSCLENLMDTGSGRVQPGWSQRGLNEHVHSTARSCIRWFTPFFSLPFLYPLARKLSLHLHRHKGLHIACLRYTRRPSFREHSQARGPEKTSSKQAKGYFGKESQGCEYSKCSPER